MKNRTVRRLVLSAMIAALCCVATLVSIPAPLGYVNAGDGLVLLSGWLLGPVYGSVAAAVGSALADLILGFPTYIPATFIIKGLMALLGHFVFKGAKALGMKGLIARILSGVTGEAVMVAGYFLYAAILFGEGLSATATIPGNLIQGVFGVILGTALITVTEGLLTKLKKNI